MPITLYGRKQGGILQRNPGSVPEQLFQRHDRLNVVRKRIVCNTLRG